MNRKVPFRDVLLVGILIIVIAYYFLVQGPVSRQTEELESRIAELQTEIDIDQAKAVRKKTMQTAIDEAFKDGTPTELPEYNHLNAVITEFNALLAFTDEYNISFTDAVIEDPIARRNFTLTYRVPTYEMAKEIIRQIEASSNRYLIQSEAIVQDDYYENKTDYGWDVSLSVICFEYVK